MSGSIGEVGAVFQIEDKASAALLKISDSLERVQGFLDEALGAAERFANIRFTAITDSLTVLTDKLDQASTAMERMASVRFGEASQSINALTEATERLSLATDAIPTAFGTAMDRVIADTERGIAAMRGLQTEMGSVAASASRMSLVPVGGGGGRRGGGAREVDEHGRPRGHLRVTEGGVSAGGMIPVPGIGAMVAGLAGYEAIKWAGEQDLALRNAAMNLGVQHPESPEGQRTMQIIGDSIAKGTAGTRFSQREVAPALVPFYGEVLSGLPADMPAEEKAKRLSGLSSYALRFAETEVQMGHGTLESEMLTSGQFSHLLREYDPHKMGPVFDRLLTISRMTGQDPTAIERVMKYAVTTGGLGNANTDQILSIVGFLMQGGVTGTTAGTGLAALDSQIDKAAAGDTGAKAAVQKHFDQAAQERRDFEAATHGNFGAQKTIEDRVKEAKEKKDPKAIAALKHLGVLAPDDQLLPQFRTEDAGRNDIAILQHLAEAVAADPKKGPGQLEMALGQRGARAVEPFMREGGQVFKNYIALEQELTKTLGVWQTQLNQASAPLQQFEQFWARLQDFGVALMNVGGPEHSALATLGNAAKAAADALEGWTKALSGFKPPSLSPGDVVRNTMGGGGPGGGDALSKFMEWWTGKTAPPSAGDPTKSEHGVRTLPKAPPATTSGTGLGGIPAELDFAPLPGKISYHPPSSGGGVNVNIQNVNFAQGTPREHADQFTRELTEALARSQYNDLSPGYGHLSSPYSAGRQLST